jgi:hypothetical protein
MPFLASQKGIRILIVDWRPTLIARRNRNLPGTAWFRRLAFNSDRQFRINV